MRKALTILGCSAPFLLAPLAGCSTTHAHGFGDEQLSTTKHLSNAHVMPVHRAGTPYHKPKNPIVAQAENAAAASGAQLTYQGGPLLQAVKIYVVYWGQGVDSTVQSGIAGFYSDVTASSYFDWLTEYDANAMTIGHGNVAGSFTITPSTGSSTVDDSQIGAEIDAQITSGTLPANDANNLYMMYFPPGVNITMDGSQSCVQFCAYHSTLTRQNSSNLYYGVLPDLGGACAGGCGSGSLFQSTTEVSSHELAESVTDPAVGINVLSWYDNTNGEIGDICNGEPGTVDGYQVQLLWSNAENACIDQAPGNGGSSSGGSGGGSGSGSGGSSGGGSGSGSGGGSGGGVDAGNGDDGGATGDDGGGSSSGGGGSCAYSEQEPNDTIDEADDLSNGCLSGNLDPAGDIDFAAFQLSDGQSYDVNVAASGDGNVVLYKWYQGQWVQVASTSPTEIQHVSQGGGYYATIVYSPGQQVQSYTVTLAVQ